MGWMVPGSNPSGGKIFSTRPDWPWDTSFKMDTGSLYQGVNWLVNGVNHPPPSSAEIKKRSVALPVLPHWLSWPVIRWTLTFYTLFIMVLHDWIWNSVMEATRLSNKRSKCFQLCSVIIWSRVPLCHCLSLSIRGYLLPVAFSVWWHCGCADANSGCHAPLGTIRLSCVVTVRASSQKLGGPVLDSPVNVQNPATTSLYYCCCIYFFFCL
jgi:hypothetical protein